jgi:hypothetical protein
MEKDGRTGVEELARIYHMVSFLVMFVLVMFVLVICFEFRFLVYILASVLLRLRSAEWRNTSTISFHD